MRICWIDVGIGVEMYSTASLPMVSYYVIYKYFNAVVDVDIPRDLRQWLADEKYVDSAGKRRW